MEKVTHTASPFFSHFDPRQHKSTRTATQRHTYHHNNSDGKCFWNQGRGCLRTENLQEQRRKEKREGNNGMTEWKQGNRTESRANMGFPNGKHPSTLSPPLIRMCVEDFRPSLAGTVPWQISPGHHDRPWHRLHWNKGLTPVPNVLVYPQAPLYSITPSVLNAAVS